MTLAAERSTAPEIRNALIAAIPKLRAFAISLSGNGDRADDLVQETCVRVLRARETTVIKSPKAPPVAPKPLAAKVPQGGS